MGRITVIAAQIWRRAVNILALNFGRVAIFLHAFAGNPPPSVVNDRSLIKIVCKCDSYNENDNGNGSENDNDTDR